VATTGRQEVADLVRGVDQRSRHELRPAVDRQHDGRGAHEVVDEGLPRRVVATAEQLAREVVRSPRYGKVADVPLVLEQLLVELKVGLRDLTHDT
jgi:hypothetical protein